MMNDVVVGDIFVYMVPFADKSMEKPRPVLIVSAPNTKGDIMVLAGSSKTSLWNETYQLIIRQEDLAEGILEKQTVFPCSKQLVASPKFFRAKIGALKPNKIEKVLRLITL